MFKDYYDILRCDANATASEIKSAYRRRSKEVHPDLNPGHDMKRVMQDVNEAYAILSNPMARSRYDAEYRRLKAWPASSATAGGGSEQRREARSESSYSWDYYQYDVEDQQLKDLMSRARAEARGKVEELLRNLRKDTGKAARGAAKESAGYSVGCLILVPVGLIVWVVMALCIIKWGDPPSPPDDPRLSQLDSINLSSLPVWVDTFPQFKAPAQWTRYHFVDGGFSLSVPPTVELRGENQLLLTNRSGKKNKSVAGEAFCFQQKGLSNARVKDADNHFCRIILTVIQADGEDFLNPAQVEPIDGEMRRSLSPLAGEQSPFFQIISGPSYRWVHFNGVNAIETSYRRKGNRQYTTYCQLYLLQNRHKCLQIVLSYREQEANLWKEDFGHVMSTFSWD